MDKKMVKEELSKLTDIREDFLNYFDESIPKKNNNIEFDFENNPTIDAKKVYEHFFKLDYQARKLRSFIVKELELKA
ncbi:hypothetical protein [Sulfurospirillum arcachonense]|uniref:hypothetical protein n=1 Tax=Sulfurospirillum arcachonense TaxID=57666 RepID=UPI0004688F47|nr:hypothetical protein [Sulfurospirillum arcachonense]